MLLCPVLRASAASVRLPVVEEVVREFDPKNPPSLLLAVFEKRDELLVPHPERLVEVEEAPSELELKPRLLELAAPQPDKPEEVRVELRLLLPKPELLLEPNELRLPLLELKELPRLLLPLLKELRPPPKLLPPLDPRAKSEDGKAIAIITQSSKRRRALCFIGQLAARKTMQRAVL